MATKTIYINSANHRWLIERETKENSISKQINDLIDKARNGVYIKPIKPTKPKKADNVKQDSIESLKQAEKAFQEGSIKYNELQQYKAIFGA